MFLDPWFLVLVVGIDQLVEKSDCLHHITWVKYCSYCKLPKVMTPESNVKKLWLQTNPENGDPPRENREENMLNKCSKQDLISIMFLVIVVLILKVVRNLFKTFHLDGSMGFRFKMIVHV